MDPIISPTNPRGGLAPRLLGGLVLLFVLLGLGYSSLTPIFENSDETLHYPFIKHLADGRGLPLAIPDQLWQQEGTQPPLYYAIVAASTFWIDSDNLDEFLQRNPHWLFTEVRAQINDNQNLVLHGPMETFPYRRAALAIHFGRWWSLVFGLITVVATFLVGCRLFPNNLPLVFTATALTGLNPQFLRVSATVSNDSLSAALATLAVLLALNFTEPRRPGRALSPSPITFGYPHAILLGLLAGLAVLTKLSSLTTAGLVAVIIFWRLFVTGELHQAPFGRVVRWLLALAGTVLLLTGWWFLRNYQLYGEWLATDTHLNLAGRSPLTLAGVWELRLEAERAYWATFGWGQIRPPEWVYRIFFSFTRLGLVGLVLALLAWLIQGDKHRPLPIAMKNGHFAKVGLLLLWAGLNLALYLRWVMEVGSVSHTRLVFPAIAAFSLLLALGWHAWLPRRLAAGFSGLVAGLLLVLNVYSLGGLIAPAFTPPSPPASGPALDFTFLDRLKVVEAAVLPPAAPGETVLLKVRWQTLAPLDRNYSVAAVLLAPDGTVLARRETYPGLGQRPTRYLQPGDSFWDVYPLRLAGEVREPLVARAVVSLFDFDSDTRAGFPALDAAGREVTPVVGLVKIVPRTWPEVRPQVPARATFAGSIRLTGYDLALPEPGAEAPGRLTLYWQSLAPVPADYNLFLHLLNAAGETIGQADGPPTGNVYPTRWWAPCETVADSHPFPVPPGTTRLRLGFYELESGQRLPVTESTLPGQNDSVEISLP